MINGNADTVSCAVAIAAGPQPRSRWGARSEASTTWAAARIPAVSWIRPLAVAKTVRWSSQKVTGLLWANPPSFGAYHRLGARPKVIDWSRRMKQILRLWGTTRESVDFSDTAAGNGSLTSR